MFRSYTHALLTWQLDAALCNSAAIFRAILRKALAANPPRLTPFLMQAAPWLLRLLRTRQDRTKFELLDILVSIADRLDWSACASTSSPICLQAKSSLCLSPGMLPATAVEDAREGMFDVLSSRVGTLLRLLVLLLSSFPICHRSG
jgi:hypothetical protein